jgi:hypothetical protein
VALHEGTNAQYEPGSLQVRPCAVQSSHESPAAPHAVLALPDRQNPRASQQPPQLVGSHGGVVEPAHLPAVQAKPVAEQMAQTPPPTPHASSSEPSRQRPSGSQQPAHEAWQEGAVP